MLAVRMLFDCALGIAMAHLPFVDPAFLGALDDAGEGLER
jgi:hypothetical protein